MTLDALDMMPHNLDEVALPLSRYRAKFRVADPVRLPPFAGAAWRGAFGHALKHALCVTQAPECPGCTMYRECGYAYVFETPRPTASTKMRKYATVPHPFVLDIEVPEPVSQSDIYQLGFTLFGHGNTQFDSVAHAIEQAGIKGIGADRARFILERIEQFNFEQDDWVPIRDRGRRVSSLKPLSPPVPPVPPQVKVTLAAPLRLRRDSAVVGPADFSFGPLFRNLLRRISMLRHFHTDYPLEVDFAALVHEAGRVEIDAVRLRWFDFNRFSTRQARNIKTGGLIGEFTVGGSALSEFWPYLWLGQYTHAGAATSMGMGRYLLEPLED